MRHVGLGDALSIYLQRLQRPEATDGGHHAVGRQVAGEVQVTLGQRVLGRYSRELTLFSLRTAIHKMTGLPAQRFGLTGRGLVLEGYAADLVLFNPETIIDTATFTDPVQPAEGITAVWVNGVLSYESGRATGRRAGRFLPRGTRNTSVSGFF